MEIKLPLPSMPAELNAVVALCRTVLSPPRQLAQMLPDAHGLAPIAARHRVEGLVWHALGTLALPACDGLATAAREISLKGLKTAVECARLQGVFRGAGIDLLFLKGLAVGKLAFGNPFLKSSWDIDLLINHGDVGAASELLSGLGYQCVAPGGAVGDVVRWHAREKESVWKNGDGHHFVELHSRLADNRSLIPSLGMQSPRQSVEVAPGIVLPTLATDELFAYLCVHGASSAWFRLKWVADFAGVIGAFDAVELDRLHARSQQLGAGRAAAQGLMVTDALFGLPLSPALRRALWASPANRLLTRIALGELAAPVAPTGRRLGTMMIHFSQLLLGPGWRFAAGEARRQWRSARRQRKVA